MNTTWQNDSAGLLNGIPLRYVSGDFAQHKTSQEQIVVLKPRTYFDQYAVLLETIGKTELNIIELGIFEGGSTLLLADYFPEARIAAFDLRDSNPSVENHVRTMGYAERVKLNYRVSQTDRKALLEGAHQSFGKEPVHVVIDDASHFYEQSRASFEILFPLLEKGGLYIIEDWAWAHWRADAYDNWPGIALTSLVLELAMAVGSRPDMFPKLEIYPGMAVIRKGVKPTPEKIELSALIKVAPRRWRHLSLDDTPADNGARTIAGNATSTTI